MNSGKALERSYTFVLTGALVLSACMAFVSPAANARENVRSGSGSVFGPSIKFDQGHNPSVSINGDATCAVEVHKSQSHNTLWYSVGHVNVPGKSVGWGSSHQYDTGKYPDVAVGTGGVIVEVHQSGSGNNLWYHVGKLDTAKKTVDWGTAHQYDTGEYPSVAIRSDGLVVEVHQSSNYSDLWYRVGFVDSDHKTIDWGTGHKYTDNGVAPSVGLDDAGNVVEAAQTNIGGAGDFALAYHVGTVDRDRRTIDWGSGHDFGDGYYSVGIDLRNDGTAMEVHANMLADSLYYHVGKIDTDHKTINWGSQQHYDSGDTPDVSLADSGGVIEVHKSQSSNDLWCHIGTVSSPGPINRTWAHNTVGTPEASTDWFLAEGCTGGGFETWILVQNPGVEDANVNLTYMTPDGSVPGPTQVVRAGSRATFNAADAVGSTWEVSTRVTSDEPVVAERSVYGNNRSWAHNSIGAPEAVPGSGWLLAEGCTAGGFETWILVQNPGVEDANVNLTYMTPEGAVQGPARTVNAGSRATFNTADTIGNAWQVATRVDSDGPIVAERSMYGNNREWGTGSVGTPDSSKDWLLAEGSTGDGFETWVLVCNPGNEEPAQGKDAHIQLTYLTPDGEVPGPSATLKPGTRATFNAADTVGSTWEVAARVTSDEPVVAERAMYGNERAWAHNSIGAPQAANRWFLAEGCTGAGFETWILVGNPGGEDASVNITYMTPDGETVGPSVVVKAGTRATFNAADTVGSTWEVAARVTSDQPVVVERAMYGEVPAP